MAIAPLIVGIRTAGAAALGAAAARLRGVAAAARTSSFATRQLTREVSSVAGAYRDANGLWRNANGTLVMQRNHVRHVTTAYGRLHRAIQRATRALVAYTIASRLAQSLSDRTARTLATMAAQFGLLAVKGAAAMAVLFPLVGVVGNLIPLVMLIAPAAGTAGLAMLGLKLAFNGVSDALSAGLSGDTEEFEKALKKLAPSAANAVRMLVKLRDVWKPLARDFQGRVFEGAAGELAGLSKFIKPIADSWLPKLAMRFAETRHELADGLARFAADGRLEAVWRNLHAAASSFLSVIKPIARVFGDVLQVAAPRFASLADTIAILATRFSDWIRAARDNGDLGRWLDKAMETFGKLKDVATNVGRIIGAIFKGSGSEGDDMLDQIVRATDKIAEWANGEDGQAIINIISKIAQAIAQLAPLFEMWAGWLHGMGILWGALWEGIKAIFRGVVMWILGGYDLLLQGAAKAFGWIPGLGDKLKAAQKSFQEFKENVNNSLNGITKTIDITVNYRARMIGNHLVSGAQQSGTYSSGIGGRASGGPVRRGDTRWVGENGPEVVTFGASGMVHNAQVSRRMAGGGSSAPIRVMVAAGPAAVGNPMVDMVLSLFRNGQLRMTVDRSGRVVPA